MSAIAELVRPNYSFNATLLMCFSLLQLTACLPFRVKQQPELVFHVTDPEGRPIQGAFLRFARYSYHPFAPSAKQSTVVEALTGVDGHVHIPEQFDWKMGFLAPDGGPAHYGWSWCFEKSGFAGELGNNLSESNIHSPIVVVLHPTAERATCILQRNSEFELAP